MRKISPYQLMSRILIALSLLFTSITQAQNFKMEYGGNGFEEARCILKLKEGGYLIGGRSSSLSGNTDMHILKVDASGGLVWEQKIGDKQTEETFGIIEATDGNYIIIGDSDSFGSSRDITDIWVVKINKENGNKIWAKTFGTDESIDSGRAIVKAHDGGYMILGHSFKIAGDQTSDLFVAKIDENGELVWKNNYGGEKNEQGVSIAKTEDGYTILANTESQGKGKWDIWMFHIDKEGKKTWEQSYGGGDNEMANAFIQTKEGYMIVGYTYSFAMASLDFWVVKADTEGKQVWHKVFGGMSTDEAFSILQTSDNKYVVAGYTEVWKGNKYGENESKDGHNIFLVKIDENGNKIWERSIGGEHDQRAFSVAESADKGLILVGFNTANLKNGTDVLIMKVGKEGN